MSRLSISKEKVEKKSRASTESKKRPSPSFEREQNSDEEMIISTQNVFNSLKKTKVFDQNVFKTLKLQDLQLLSEFQK